ncbi:MAG: 2-oxoglutarate oxidoreductase, partial [Deltaproteobacteria bacterium]|nr:2-oxoglutarate oxidoreductase [Deltaproteobacteria bacterium]
MTKTIFKRPKSLKENIFHYCPGCGHSIAHRLIAEIIDEMEIRGVTIGVPPAGCAVLAYNYFDVDMIEAPHGRGPAMASGIKRVLLDRFVFSYQGDGDLAAIGIAESFHAANRGENITVIFINNAVYGMTGGQMAPTTMLEQKTTTTPAGRHKSLDGYP